MVDITQTLILISKQMNINFTLHDKPLRPEEVFAETGLLPAIVRRADQLCSFCFGYGLGVAFVDDERSQLGVKTNFSGATAPTLCIMCVTEILFELSEASPNRALIALDDLMYD